MVESHSLEELSYNLKYCRYNQPTEQLRCSNVSSLNVVHLLTKLQKEIYLHTEVGQMYIKKLCKSVSRENVLFDV